MHLRSFGTNAVKTTKPTCKIKPKNICKIFLHAFYFTRRKHACMFLLSLSRLRKKLYASYRDSKLPE